VEAWACFSDDSVAFNAWLDSATTFVAVSEANACLGFGGLQQDGRVASLFVSPDVMRTGIGSALLERLIQEAGRLGYRVLTTAASELSRPLFERHGFGLSGVEHTEFKGVAFSRYLMDLRL
jgi:putative acetyltransferase